MSITKDCARVIGANIRKSRKEHNVRLKDLSEFLCVSPSMLSQYEAGYRSVSMERLSMIASYLKISLTSLTEGTDISEVTNRRAIMTVHDLIERLQLEPNKNKVISVKHGCLIVGGEYIIYDEELNDVHMDDGNER